MIFANHSVTLTKSQYLYLVPIGDLQTTTELGRLTDLVKWLLAREKEGHKVRLFGMGDYFESPAPSDRAALASAKRGFGVYEELARDITNIYVKRTKGLAQQLMPLRGRILGLLQGHHYLEIDSTIPGVEKNLPKDTTQLLAREIKADFWGDTVQLNLTIHGLPFKVFAMHGYGSARTPGARIIKRHRMREVVLDANWYIMAHDNEKSVYVTEVLVGREYLKQYYTGSGSFQRSYNFDEPVGTYAEKLALPPSSLGVVICVVKLQRGKFGQRLDYHISA